VTWSVRAGSVLVPFTHSAGMNLITLLAFRYLTDNLAVSAAAAGALFALVKIYDGVLDPAVGALSDATRSTWGRRLPYLLAGALLMPVSVALVFHGPTSMSPAAVLAVAAVALLLQATAYTLLTIPGMAMVVEVSDDYHERSALMSYRVVGNTLGVLGGSTMPAWLLARWGATYEGHARMSWVVAVMLLLAGVMAVVLLRHAPQTIAAEAPRRLRASHLGEQFRLAWANRPFRLLAITHIFVLIGTAVTSIGNSYFTKYVLVLSDKWLGTYYVLATVGVIGSMPAWLRLAKAGGKKFCYMLAMAGFGLMHLSWLLAARGEPYPLLVLRALLVGVASAGMILFAYSMLSDAIRYDYICTGLRREGSFAGLTSLIDKLAAAAGISGVGLFMSAMGYAASSAGAQATQSPSAILAIYLSFTIVPGIAMVCGLVTMLGYHLHEDDLRAQQLA
jgi:GPH family glycoside/pentoside/hexuronide:cation symporter